MSFIKIKNRALFLGFFCLFLLSGFSGKIGPLSFSLFDIAALFLFFLVGLEFLYKKIGWYKGSLIFNSFVAHFLLLAIYPLLGFITNSAPFLDVSVMLRWIFFVCIFLYLIYELRRNERFLGIFFSALLFSGVLNSVYGTLMLIDTVLGLPFTMPHYFIADIFNWKVDHHMRIPALFAGPNQLGWYALLGVLISFSAFIQTSKFYYFVIFLLHLYLLVLSTARTAIIVFLFVFLFVVFMYSLRSLIALRFKKNILFIVFSAFFGLLVLIYFSYAFNVFRIDGLLRAFGVLSGNIGSVGFFSSRTELWPQAISFYKYEFYPFGTWVTPTYYTGTIDSGWLTYLVWSGPFMVISSALMFVVNFSYGIIGFIKRQCSFSLSLAMASLALAIGQVTLSPLHYIPVLVLYCILICLAYLNKRNRLVI